MQYCRCKGATKLQRVLYRGLTLIFKTLYFLLQAYPMNYPTNLLRAFAVVCSWRILRAKI